MIALEVGEARIFVRPGATDMRKQINGLVVIVEEQMESNVFEPALFLFCDGGRRILKALYWDRTGFCLWQLCEASHNPPGTSRGDPAADESVCPHRAHSSARRCMTISLRLGGVDSGSNQHSGSGHQLRP
jgi:hypothetical protein